MSRSRSPKLLDVIAALQPPPDSKLEAGDVGTVVELLSSDAVEVEFLDATGGIRAVEALPNDHVLVLHFDRAAVA